MEEILPLKRHPIITLGTYDPYTDPNIFMSTLTNSITYYKLIWHVVLAVLIVIFFHNVGDDAALAMKNAWCIYLTIALAALAAFIPSIWAR